MNRMFLFKKMVHLNYWMVKTIKTAPRFNLVDDTSNLLNYWKNKTKMYEVLLISKTVA